jgi:MFS transporter, DHA2 family, multidrug resistance protein
MAILGCASFWASTLNLEVAPINIIIPRCVQMLGLALIFSPINTAAYQYLPREQSNNATGLFNLIRNEGSSFGVAAVTTLLARRSQFHQNRLIESTNPLNPGVTAWLDTVQQMFIAGGTDAATAKQKALAMLYNVVQQQAMALSYFDVFWLFAMAAFCAAPMVFLMRRSVAEKGAEMHH